MFEKILVALDGSPVAARAAEIGVNLAKSLSAQLAFVFVADSKAAVAPEGGVPAASLIAELKREGNALLRDAEKRALGIPPPLRFVREGNPSAEIISAAREWPASLIVIGTHGRSGLSRLVMGSTAEGVVRHAPCPALVVRGAD